MGKEEKQYAKECIFWIATAVICGVIAVLIGVNL